jgi:hypothetical protein
MVLRVVIGLICLIIIFIWVIKNKKNITNNEKLNNEKLGAVKPKLSINHPQIVDFLYSIQDFYYHNPQNYEGLIDNVNSFFDAYENCYLDNDLSNYYYQIADDKKTNALNSLHSIIFNLPTNKFSTEKLNRAHQRLETILTQFLNQLYQKCQENIIQYGFNINKKQIDIGPKGYNIYSDQMNQFYF